MESLEEALRETEEAAGVAEKAAKGVLSQVRALVKAAQTGNIAGVRRAGSNLDDAVAELADRAADACESWVYGEEEEREYFEKRFAEEFRVAAVKGGLKLHERDGLFMCYPSILRVLASERAVRVDRKKVSTVRPSFLVEHLLKEQQKTASFQSARFLESLYNVYRDVTSDEPRDLLSPHVVPLMRLYRLMTALPGAAREYGRSDFARDLYILQSEGPHRTRKGAEVSFPSSTGTRRRSSDVFTFVGPEGDSAEYYGISFTGARR